MVWVGGCWCWQPGRVFQDVVARAVVVDPSFLLQEQKQASCGRSVVHVAGLEERWFT